jgi:ribosomal protein S18 acetylase RimI-like enzyme
MDPQKYPFLPNPEQRYRNWLGRCVSDPRALLLVAAEGDALLGFLVATVEDEIPIYRVQRYGFIQDLWVEPEHRHHGVGRQLLLSAIEQFRHMDVQQVRLDVLTCNDSARRLFESCGFRASVTEMLLPLA